MSVCRIAPLHAHLLSCLQSFVVSLLANPSLSSYLRCFKTFLSFLAFLQVFLSSLTFASWLCLKLALSLLQLGSSDKPECLGGKGSRFSHCDPRPNKCYLRVSDLSWWSEVSDVGWFFLSTYRHRACLREAKEKLNKYWEVEHKITCS